MKNNEKCSAVKKSPLSNIKIVIDRCIKIMKKNFKNTEAGES
jgi:hypothetical protein